MKGSQRRCKACAVDYLRSFETDRFETQAQITPIVLSEERIQEIQNKSSSCLPPVPREVRAWSETEYRRRNNVKMWVGIGLILLVFTLVLWALVNG